MKQKIIKSIDGEIELPLQIFSAYLGYIDTMIAVTDSKNSYKELGKQLPGAYSNEDLEKWFYETLAYVAALKLERFKHDE